MDAVASLEFVAAPENFDAGSREWSQICDQLRQRLSAEDDLAIVALAPGALPKNAKGEPITIGAFIIALASAPAVIKLAQILNVWIANLGNRKVRVEIGMGKDKVLVDAKGIGGKDIDRLEGLIAGVLRSRK